MGAINEILPKATGVGKVDASSDGTGEVFNRYEGYSLNVASGSASHAEGGHTRAEGDYSHAEGSGTTATGESSHAEGYGTNAEGKYSHAEGSFTHARGISSHAEGGYTNASGTNSHAEGSDTNAEGTNSHAEGTYTQTFSSSEHAEGYSNKSYDSKDPSVRVIHSVGIGSSNSNRKNAHEIKFNGDHYVYGVGGFDGTNSADAQTLQEVINNKAEAFTAGTGLEMTSDRKLNVTLDTTVFYVVETLPLTPAEGNENKICLVPTDSAAIQADEIGTIVTRNEYTEYIWMGNRWEELGKYYSEVDLTPYLKIADAVGKIDSTSDGTGEIFNNYEGDNANVASGNSSHAEGSSTAAEGKYSHAEGSGTIASGTSSHAEGSGTTASGTSSHAEGYGTIASGYYSHAEGSSTAAEGVCSHAEGSGTIASGTSSHAEGYGTIASGYYSHAEGYNVKATGGSSHAEGSSTAAEGKYSHAEGLNTTAKGVCSHAEGGGTTALNIYEHAEGCNNISNSGRTDELKTRHSVGIGKSKTDRKNAHEIMANGDHYIYGIGGYDGKNATANTSSTLQQIINTMFNITVDLREYDTVMSNDGGGFKIADLSDQHYINGADIFIKDNDIEGAIKYFVVEKNENIAKTINFSNGTTFEYTQEYELKRNEVESAKVYARYGKYSTEEKSKWWLMRITPAGGGSN